MTALNARTIAQTMGGDVVGRDSVNVPGPGHSKADRSLSIKLSARAPAGFIVFSHCGDDPIECRDYVKERLGLSLHDGDGRYSATPLAVAVAGGEKDEQNRRDFALKIWHQSSDPTGTIVEKYLRDERGLTLPASAVSSVVRYHGRLRYGEQTFAGMVCLMRSIGTDEPTGIHRTFIDAAGKKIDRRMLGIAKGAAIKIDAHSEIGGKLTIGEGFETVLASKLAGYGSAWALGSAGAVQAFPVLEQVSELTILEERDATSRKATRKCRSAYLSHGRKVNVLTPKRGFKDFNDVWLEVLRADAK